MQGYMRFEKVCEAFINATDEQREQALELLSEEQRQAFLQGVGQYRLLTDERYCRAAIEAMGPQIYRELREEG